MPSGRDIYTPKKYAEPSLDSETLAKMRAPIDRDELEKQRRAGDDDSDTNEDKDELPGAFPGGASASDSTYY